MSKVEEHPFQIRRHYEILAVAGLVVVLSLILQVRSDERVIVTGFPEYPLPHACLSYVWFGIRCPGCGLTRSLVHLAHGDWTASWHDHRVGWLMALAILLQFPYRLIALWRGGSPLGIWVPRLFGYALIALLVGNWLLESLWK